MDGVFDKMRKFIVFILIVTTSISLISCELGENMKIMDNDHRKAQETIENVLESIQNKDADMLKALFSKTTLNQLQSYDESIEELFGYFNGSVESYDDGIGPFVETTKENGVIFQIMESSFRVKTDLCEYRFAMQYVTQGNTGDIGVVSLYVIKTMDDENLDYIYWGDGKFLPGIHIAISNVI